MATDKWLEFNGVEIVNLSRVAQLADALGIDSVWGRPVDTEWIEDALTGSNYYDVTAAPWYDEGFPASAEFAGIVPLGFPGLDDSSAEASTQEYVTAGGRSGKRRNSTLPIVASVAIVALTDRGADYGKRWLDRVLRGDKRGAASRADCSGADLRYFRYPSADAPVAHRRQVRLTRGTSVTRKRSTDCSVTWLATFTLTCDDPFEYGEPIGSVVGLGTPSPTATLLHGTLALIEESCPAYDYTPVYDPLYPALVPSPASPDLLPAGWVITDDLPFTRYWARVASPEPTALSVVPLLILSTDTDTRTVRVSIWPSTSTTDTLCGPLFSAVVSYLPGGGSQFFIDGEQEAAYVWDGVSPVVRRTDSLVYAPNAKPVEWSAFSDSESLLVTLDLFETPAVADVELSLSFVPKSD